MLDLRELKSKAPYQIKLENGTILNIKLPTQKLLEKMVELENYKGNTAEAVEAIYDIVAEIFNNNTNNLSFSSGELKTHSDFAIFSYIIHYYFHYLN